MGKPGIRQGRNRERGFATVIVLGAHVAVLVMMAWGLRSSLVAPVTPVIELDLEQDDFPRDDRRPARRQGSPRAPLGPATPAAAALQAAPSSDTSVVVASKPLPGTNDAEKVQRLGAILRQALGCERADLYRLSAAERQACLDRQTQDGRGSPLAGIPPDKRATFAADKQREPFLARTPKNNCVPRVQEKDMPGGAGAAPSQDWRTGVACALSF